MNNTTQKNEQQEREKFEKWAMDEHSLLPSKDISGEYLDSFAHYAWLGWQAALSRPSAIRAQAMEEAAKVCESMDTTSYPRTEGDEHFSTATAVCAAAIRSLASQPVQDGYVLMPTRLTDENGAKAALSGEFAETYYLDCPDCADVGEVCDDCETCHGEGEVPVHLPIEWATIKAIYAKAVEVCAAPTAAQRKGE